MDPEMALGNSPSPDVNMAQGDKEASQICPFLITLVSSDVSLHST